MMKEDGDSRQVVEPKKNSKKQMSKKKELKLRPATNERHVSAAGDCRLPTESSESEDSKLSYSLDSSEASGPFYASEVNLSDKGNVDCDFRRLYFDFTPLKTEPCDPELAKKGVFIDNFKTIEGTDEEAIKSLVKNNMPRISASSNGVITVELPHGIEIDISIESNIRVRTPNFTVMSTMNGQTTALLHRDALILQERLMVNGYFPPSKARHQEQNVVMGPKGIVFAVSNNPRVYHLNFYAQPMVRQFDESNVNFPNMKFDFVSQIFFSNCFISEKRLLSCLTWLHAATVSRMFFANEYIFQISIGPLLITLNGNEKLEVNCIPQLISCDLTTGSVNVRNGNRVKFTTEDSGAASIRFDKRRVHISCSGIVASDQAVIASIDHYGQFSCF